MIEEKKLKIEKVDMSEDGRYAKFVCEPLDRGYGITLGNSLRRVLLSSLDGAAITSIKIEGVLHEFSTIPGIREDVTDIILNLKQLCLRMQPSVEGPVEVTVEAGKSGVLTAGDLASSFPPDIEILNHDLPIATLDENAKLSMVLRIERGKGYVPSTKNKREDDMIGVIPIDSIFSPILRAKYEVSDVRVGNEMDFDKLTMEVWTDGSISAADAIAKSASIMMTYLEHFKHIAHSLEVVEDLGNEYPSYVEEKPQEVEENDFLKAPIEDLNLSVRAFNCLKRSKIDTVAELVDRTVEDLEKVRNLGKTTIAEIQASLEKYEHGPLYLKEKGE